MPFLRRLCVSVVGSPGLRPGLNSVAPPALDWSEFDWTCLVTDALCFGMNGIGLRAHTQIGSGARPPEGGRYGFAAR